MESLKKTLVTLTVLSLWLFNSADASAAFLRGYLKHDNQKQLQSQASSGQSTANGAIANSFPGTFEGIWRCQTIILDSQVPGVACGQTLTSIIRFVRDKNGHVYAQWLQPGWNESQSTVETYNEHEAKLVRTNCYINDGASTSWSARSCDQFQQIDDATMVAQSDVDQYIDGLYLGRYRTKSTLSRMTQTCDFAQIADAFSQQGH